MLVTAEQEIAQQFQRFANGFARLDASAPTRVSRLPVSLPWASRLFPRAAFDVRPVFLVHAKGIAAAASAPPEQTPRDKAFTMTAELLLMQHTCHWFCRSKQVASARLRLAHKTPYEQVLTAVSPQTRAAYSEQIEARA